MLLEITDRLLTILQCPLCGGPLLKTTGGLSCDRCPAEFPNRPPGVPDLRLPRPKSYPVEFTLGEPLPEPSSTELGLLPFHPQPQVDYSGVHAPTHLSKEMLSHFPKARNADSHMLDLGCGDAIHREVCEYAGFQYVGLDYGADGAPIFGDAHALPFRDESFEFILCIAVLEHIRYPFVMMREAARVLKPGGLLIGTVSFLEPFHQNSFYHHTHLGVANSLASGGFVIEHLCPGEQWSVLMAQAHMALFPKMPPRLAGALIKPLQWMHKLWWWIGGLVTGRNLEKTRVTTTTGAFTFIARKPAT